MVIALALLGACGGKRAEAKDPADENKPPAEEIPKWEGAGPQPEQRKPTDAQVNEGTRRRSDQYDKEATEVVLKRSARMVKENCGHAKGDDGKATGPWGKATVQVMLGANGHSKGVTVPAPYQGKPVGNCVEKAFANLTFPPWAGSDTPVDWEVEIVDPNTPPATK